MSRTLLAGLVLASAVSLSSTACDREGTADEGPAAAAAPVDTALAAQGPGEDDRGTQPDEIYFDLTAYAWYREGRPLVHEGRSYAPQADPGPVTFQLRQAGTYEGVNYYVAEDAAVPVYTIYVPVYYRYWQRFTAPPGR